MILIIVISGCNNYCIEDKCFDSAKELYKSGMDEGWYLSEHYNGFCMVSGNMDVYFDKEIIYSGILLEEQSRWYSIQVYNVSAGKHTILFWINFTEQSN